MRPPQTPTVTKSLFANYLRLLRVLPQTATDDLRAYPAAARSLRRREDAGRRACQSPARPQSTGRRPASHMRSARYRARHRVRPQDPAMRESAHRAPALHPRWPWSPPFGSAPPKVSLPYGRDSGSAACSRCRSTRFLCVLVLFSRPVWGIFGLVEGESP